MNFFCFILILNIGFVSIFARSALQPKGYDEASRSLKGILNHLKVQPAVADSTSLETISNEEDIVTNSGISYHLDLSGKDEEAQRQIENKEFQKFENEPVVFENVNEEQMKKALSKVNVETENVDQTTLMTILADSDSNLILSKSDLYSDGLDDIDADGCSEGDVMRVSCNTCVCSEGKYFCSKRDCNDKEIPLPPLQKSSTKKKGTITYHIPRPDGSFKNDTSLEAEPSVSSNSTTVEITTLASQCIDGRTRPVDCNQCVCALGRWACTKMSCIALTLREKASFNGGEFLKKVDTLREFMNMDEDCSEGETKKLGCNQCVCHRQSWACSDFTCPSTEAPLQLPEDVAESCQTEEDVKSKECNICSCRRGVWVCTKNDCKKFGNRYYHPVSQKHTSNENDQDDA